MIYEKYIRVLYIDLKSKKIRIEHREDLREYLGGVGVASKLLEENIKPDLSPLDEEQPIILALGAASSIYPVVTKTVAMFYSPLTAELGESYAGGRLALTICLFARKVYDRKTILSALNAIGYDLTDEDLTAIADRVYKTKLRIKDMLGFDLMKVRLPKRFFETPSLWGNLDEGFAYEMIGMYDKKLKEFTDK